MPTVPGNPSSLAGPVLRLTAQEIAELRAFFELLDRWDRDGAGGFIT